MRVATFNLLHGVPLRDRIGSVGSRAAADDPADGAAAAAVAEAEGDAPEATAVAPEATGLDPTQRHRWMPEVDGVVDLLRAADELQQDGPLDILALQEVDRHQPRSARADQAGALAEHIGARWWRFVPSVRGTPGIAAEGASWVPATEADDRPEGDGDQDAVSDEGPRYGVALLSRWPVRAWRVRRFPPAPVSLPLMAPTAGRPRAVRVPDEPRSAVAAVVEGPRCDITVATAHLTFVPGYNTRQLADLRAFLAGMPRPLILLGDFNLPGGIPNLVTGWQQVARVPTYPVAKPRVQFDHILADGWSPEKLAEARATARAVPLPVSDHCALVAEFPEP